MNYWTTQEDALLIELHEAGLTYAAMGKTLNRTKNSCISRSRILKLTARPTPKHPTPMDRVHKTPTSAIVNKTTHSAKLPEWEGQNGIGILELKEKTCRWPSKDKPITFCGCRVFKDKAYCLEHYMRAIPETRLEALKKELSKSVELV